jgi:hypothetical protein
MNPTGANQYPTTMQYQPHRDIDLRVTEPALEYVSRMQESLLPHWPAEVLREWLHRHADFIEDYAFLGCEKFRFTKVTWELQRIPGREAFRDESFCDNFQNLEARATDNVHDWLAHYMLREGTWNTPIVLLDNPNPLPEWKTRGVKTPYHLLEGHRRLSFLQGLRRLKRAFPEHQIWIARIP